MDISTMTIDPSLLLRLDLFRNVSPESIEVYLEQSNVVEIRAGEILIEPGKENTHIYCLLSGRLSVHLGDAAKPPYTSMDPGECVGEMSIIEQKEPSAYVIASDESRLLMIPQDTLWAMVDSSHAIARNLLYILSRRVRHDDIEIAGNIEDRHRFEQYARIDELTGLHNRRWMNEMFEREIKRCEMDNDSLCIAMLDVDNFKHFNDRYGHLVGDRVLSIISTALLSYLRPSDMVARYGGDEFSILLPQTDVSEALTIAERLRNGIAGLPLGRHRSETLTGATISIGTAQMQTGDTSEALLYKADMALYQAKQSGRNCISQF